MARTTKKRKSTYRPDGKKSKIETQVIEHGRLATHGRMLAIDPASGASSMPGYALYVSGELVDAGVIEVNPRAPVHERLHYILKCIQTDFPEVDCLAIEHVTQIGLGAHNPTLQRAIGAIIAAKPWGAVFEVVPIYWRARIPHDYFKSDENDAIMIGYSVIATAFRLANLDMPPLRDLPSKNTPGLRGTSKIEPVLVTPYRPKPRSKASGRRTKATPRIKRTSRKAPRPV